MERRAVVCRERLIIGHCLVLSILVVRISKLNLTTLIELLYCYLGVLLYNLCTGHLPYVKLTNGFSVPGQLLLLLYF